jgi:ribosomal protein S18 acetylase RimI-like enzyme
VKGLSNAHAASGLVVRDARPNELDAVASLLAEVYSEYRPRFPADVWELYLGEIVDIRGRLADSALIVAEGDAGLVGTVGFYREASLSPLERWPTGWASIRTLAVRDKARRRGFGEALGLECIRRAKAQRALAIGLHTASFMTVATRLYERLGFRRAPDFDIEIGEMFAGRPLPPDASWQAQAFRLDL